MFESTDYGIRYLQFLLTTWFLLTCVFSPERDFNEYPYYQITGELGLEKTGYATAALLSKVPQYPLARYEEATDL
jgi:hypothetical protein